MRRVANDFVDTAANLLAIVRRSAHLRAIRQRLGVDDPAVGRREFGTVMSFERSEEDEERFLFFPLLPVEAMIDYAPPMCSTLKQRVSARRRDRSCRSRV